MSTVDEIRDIVNKSGNSFHCKVINYLKEKKWDTLVSPYYMDTATNKPREIDLIAEKWYIRKGEFGVRGGAVVIRLFIECKYIPQTNVFWFSEKDMASAKQWVVSNTPLREDSIFMENHHYLYANPKVAKLFASENRPSAENEVIYKALNQSLNAMVYLRGRKPINPEHRNRGIPILTTVEMPVILCNSFRDFYFLDMDFPDKPNKISDNFQLEINYAYLDHKANHRTEYFLMDIVDFEKIDDFLKVIENDKDAIFRML